MAFDIDLSGINPANVVPFTSDGREIDEAGLRAHLENLATNDRVDGIVTNGHAGELYALSTAERARVTELAAEATSDDQPVVSGTVAGSTTDYIDEINRMEQVGADAILAVPPHTPIHTRDDAAVRFFEDVSAGVDLPLVVFQHPVWAGGNYHPDLLAKVAQTENVVAVKDAVWDVDHFQEDHRALRDMDKDVQYLVASDEHLLPCFSLGTDGVILELAAVIPDEIADLYEAVEAGDIQRARAVYEHTEPFVNAMYADPVTDSHTRLKVALMLRGVFESAAPRPPTAPIPAEEVDHIESVMATADML